MSFFGANPSMSRLLGAKARDVAGSRNPQDSVVPTLTSHAKITMREVVATETHDVNARELEAFELL